MEFETLKEFLDKIAEKFSSLDCMYYGQKIYNYSHLKDKSNRVSFWLLSQGFQKSDRVAIWSQNRPEWVITFLATTYIGGCIVGIDNFLPLHEAYYILKDCEAKFLFISSQHIDEIRKIFMDLPDLKNIITFDNDRGFWSFQQIIESASLSERFEEIEPQQSAVLIYTSGTMGKSKAIMLSHKNLLANLNQIRKIWKLEKDDKFLSILPLSHSFELTAGLLFPLSYGAKIYYPLLKNMFRIFEEIKENKITIILVVPVILRLFRNQILKKIKYKRILKFLIKLNAVLPSPLNLLNIKRKIFPHLKFFICGGAPISKQILIELKTMGFEVLQGYGLSEASPVVSVNLPGKNKVGSAGRPLPGIEVKIEPDNIGEILIRGENVMMGYYKDPILTRQTIKDGWLHSGDIGYLDEDGFLWVVGRKKNLIVDERGRNIYPEEIEELLKASPLIKDACVVGVKTEEGEKLFAVIVPQADIIISPRKEKIIEDEIKKVNKSLASYKKIKKYKIMEEIPYTSTRKVRRSLLRHMLAQELSQVEI